MPATTLARRAFLGSAGLAALSLAQARSAQASATATPDPAEAFRYEITRTDAEWQDRLSPAEYAVLRRGGTEEKFTSPLVSSDEAGRYCCKGCDLTLFESTWKAFPNLGWVFFRQARANAILTDIDGNPYVGETDTRILSIIEGHCRRCGSHLGHILTVGNSTLYCINGTALDFVAAAA